MSLNSNASWVPVDAPEGTIEKADPFSENTSASSVGLPRLSKTCRPLIFLIFACAGSFIAGKQIGIRGTIDYLEEKGILTFDDNEK